jgi:hypothetical protein
MQPSISIIFNILILIHETAINKNAHAYAIKFNGSVDVWM